MIKKKTTAIIFFLNLLKGTGRKVYTNPKHAGIAKKLE